jgi:hypothetical protein
MDIIEARALLGVNEYATVEDINAAFDKQTEHAVLTADLAHYRRSIRAVAELFVEGGRYTRPQANLYIEKMDEFVTSVSSSIDQSVAALRDLELREQEERNDIIGLIDAKHSAEARRDGYAEQLAFANAQVEEARAALIARAEARQQRREARRKRIRRLFSLSSGK